MSERNPFNESPQLSPDQLKKKKQVLEYTPDPELHELLKKYPAHFLAKGGESFVYEIGSEENGDIRDVVIKGSMPQALSLKRLMDLQNITEFSDFPEEWKEKLNESLSVGREKYDAMRQAFGADHVAPQKRRFMKVPITPAISKELFGKDSDKKECWTVVTIQKRAKELKDPLSQAMDFGTKYVERTNITPSEYMHAAKSGLDKRSELLLEKAESDPELKEQLVDFITKAMAYSKQEHEILDFIGERNVYFYRKLEQDGTRKWSYKILDGFHARSYQRDMDKAHESLGRFEEEKKLEDQSDVSTLMNAMAFARAMNAMAEKLGLPDRIHLLDDTPKSALIGLLKEIQKRTGYSDPNATILPKT